MKLANIIDKARPYVRAAERLVPLAQGSHPIAVASMLFGAMCDFADAGPKASSGPRCMAGDFEAVAGICRAATTLGVGVVVREPEPGRFIREHDGCEWGTGSGWLYGPLGSPTALPRAVWEGFGPSIVASSNDFGWTDLATDGLDGAWSSPYGEEIAAELVALRDAGEPAGALLYGRPGTGKSVIARLVAQRLGGYSLRATLKTPVCTLVGLAEIMAPRVVILDDVDTKAAEDALDAIEQLAAGRVVIASTNHEGELPRAFLRARRLGLHYKIDTLEPAVLDAIVGSVAIESDARAMLEQSTVAEARDYIAHRRVLGAARALEILRSRVARPGETQGVAS